MFFNKYNNKVNYENYLKFEADKFLNFLCYNNRFLTKLQQFYKMLYKMSNFNNNLPLTITCFI